MGSVSAVLNLLFPPRCPFCGRILSAPGICPACEAALPWTRDLPGVREAAGSLRCAAPLWYEGAAREGLLRFKFRGASGGSAVLGALVAGAAAEAYPEGFDLVSWVPVSRERLRRRGYDQAELLCRGACRVWGVKPVRLLRKIADNPPQSGIAGAAARRANVLGVYEAVSPERIAGKRVLLVDDICTTGATLSECARVLREAGAAEVVCAAAAITRLRQETTGETGKNGLHLPDGAGII